MIFFFFFQAEDGIRDLTVTGVQTCALPICCRAQRKDLAIRGIHDHFHLLRSATPSRKHTLEGNADSHRSEEHTPELQSQSNLVCRLLLEKKKTHRRQ